MQTKLLRELVQDRLDMRWTAWAREHPHLAEIIDRTRLIDSAVDRLVKDGELEEVLQQADMNESQLNSIVAAFRVIEQAIGQLLRF